MTDTDSTPDEGEYTDEETPVGRSTHRERHSVEDEGAYTDAETPDHRSTHPDQETVGRYEDTQEPDGARAPQSVQEPAGEYTDVDLDGDR